MIKKKPEPKEENGWRDPEVESVDEDFDEITELNFPTEEDY